MPHPGQASGEHSYTYASTGFASASSATDVLAIGGKAGKLVNVKRIELTGKTTGVVDLTTIDVYAMRRSTADTTGTQVPLTAVPHRHDSPAASSYVTAFTANPGALGTLIGCVGSQRTTLATTVITPENNPAVFDFTRDIHPITLTSSDDQLCLNLNVVTIAGSALRVTVQLTERNT